MYRDLRLARFFESLVKGDTKEILPAFAPRYDGCCRYPWAEAILELPPAHVNRLLEDLARHGALRREFSEKILLCPACNSRQLQFSTACPKCGSSHITSVRVLRHIGCGLLAVETEFRNGAAAVCPKCRQQLQLLGSDYEMPGGYFLCRSCGELTGQPREHWRCSNCQELMERDEVREVCLYSYRLGSVPRELVADNGIRREQIEEFLVREGYEIQNNVQVVGRSGAVHDIDLLAIKNSGPLAHKIVVGFVTGETEVDSEEVIKLYAKAYDVNAQDIVLVATPRLSPDARQFAGHYRIRVLDADDAPRLQERLLA